MGKLMSRAGRVLGTGALVMAGAGVLLLGGAGIASARPASTGGCQKINATLASVTAMIAAHPSTLEEEVASLASQLTRAASTDSSAVKSAVSTFLTDLKAGTASGKLNDPKFTANNGDAIEAACTAQVTAPGGAPATGGGSAAGVQDPGLFGVGGAAVLVGLAVLGLARRNRPRTGAGHG